MRILIIFFSMLFSLGLQEANEKVYGLWKLVKIQTENGTMRPQKRDYILEMTENKIAYNLEVNTCGAFNLTIDNNQIQYSGGCTKVCCDGRNDSIANFIDYRGSYKLNQSQLIITSDKSTIYLKRIKNKK